MTSIAFDQTRLANITATNMATLFGLNPYETPGKLLEKKLNPEILTSVHLRRGVLREPSVMEAFRVDLNWHIERHDGGTLKLEGYPIAATPDGYRGPRREEIVEAKSVMARNFDKWYDAPPHYYVMQVFTQLLVTGRQKGYIGALEEGDPENSLFRFIVWEIDRHEEAEILMKEESIRFWKCVEDGTNFRVKSALKARMLEIISNSISLHFKSHEKKVEEELDVLSLFGEC